MFKRTSKQLSLFSSLEDMLSHEHPLFQLSNKINWERFENAFSPLYCRTNGRPAHPIRLMCGLLILKHLRNVSDEMVVSQWSENAYYQYFCGGLEFMPKQPCDASELVHFRKRIRQFGIRKCSKKLVISLLFCNFMVDNQLITNIYSDDYHRQSYRNVLYTG